MKPLFRIELPAPKSGNQILRTHWKKTHKRNQEWGWLLLEALQKDNLTSKISKQDPKSKRYLVFYLESNNPQDDNNFHLGIKGLVDHFQEGYTANFLIDDSPKYCRVFYIPVKTKKRKRKMFVELYEQSDFLERLDNDLEFKDQLFSIAL